MRLLNFERRRRIAILLEGAAPSALEGAKRPRLSRRMLALSRGGCDGAHRSRTRWLESEGGYTLGAATTNSLSLVQSSRCVSQPLLNRNAWLDCSGEQPIAASTCDGFSEPLEHAEPVDTAAPSLSSFTTPALATLQGRHDRGDGVPQNRCVVANDR